MFIESAVPETLEDSVTVDPELNALRNSSSVVIDALARAASSVSAMAFSLVDDSFSSLDASLVADALTASLAMEPSDAASDEAASFCDSSFIASSETSVVSCSVTAVSWSSVAAYAGNAKPNPWNARSALKHVASMRCCSFMPDASPLLSHPSVYTSFHLLNSNAQIIPGCWDRSRNSIKVHDDATRLHGESG